MREWSIGLVVGVYAVMSAVSFALYGIDKWKAGTGRWRIPEKTLLTADLLGGWPGGLAGQRVFRHKTSKRSFQVAFWGVVAVHAALWAVFVGDRV